MAEYRFPSSPPADALAFFRAKRYKPGFDYRDVWREEHRHAFTVAKAMQMDVLTSIRESLDDALQNGQTFAQFKRDLIPELQRQGWWGREVRADPLTRERREVTLGTPRRLKTIYSTNMRTARAAGQWQRIQRRTKTHPFLVYELGPSERHRALHESWAGIILPADHAFWKTHFPPNGWGCKCRVRQINRREADQMMESGRYSDKAPRIRRREWINERTGEAFQVPVGIDPGWDYNPGTGRVKALNDTLKRSETAVKKAVSAPAPSPNVALFPDGDNVMSTIKGIDQAGIEAALNRIPGAAPQIKKLSEFLQVRKIKTLALKQTEMGTGRKAWDLRERVSGFLGNGLGYGAYNSRHPARVGGFTSRSWDHVVVKGKATDKLDKLDGEKMAQAVEAAITNEARGRRTWSISHSYETLVNQTHHSFVSTWVHEIGHQVHYWQGNREIPFKESLTVYADTNAFEWHAEHFTAWVLNRDALARWNKDIAEYFDDAIEKAKDAGAVKIR